MQGVKHKPLQILYFNFNNIKTFGRPQTRNDQAANVANDALCDLICDEAVVLGRLLDGVLHVQGPVPVIHILYAQKVLSIFLI